MRGKIGMFSLDSLINRLTALGLKVDIQIHPRAEPSERKRNQQIFETENANVKLASHYTEMYIIPMKDVVFEKTSLDDLREFPLEARRDAGRQLDRVQRGKEPFDSKPMASIGSGVREIRITDAAGQFRVIYVAKFEDAIYVLHCFQKKTQKTSLPDVKLAKDRYNDLVRRLRK